MAATRLAPGVDAGDSPKEYDEVHQTMNRHKRAGTIARDRDPIHGVTNRRMGNAVARLAAERFGNDRVAFPAPELRWIVAGQLTVDHRFQRPLEMPWVRKIATGFDPDKFRPMLVSERTKCEDHSFVEHDSYVVIDGQHRLRAIEQMGWLDQKLPCLVYEGLTLQQEAELFASSDDVRKINRHDLHHAALAAQRPDAVTIQKIIDGFGYRLEMGGKTGDSIQCIGALYDVYRDSSPEMVAQIIDIFRQAWKPRDWQPVASSFKGMRQFLSRYAGQYDEARLISVLNTFAPMDLDRETRQTMAILRGSLGTNAARVLEKRYNRGLRTQRIPEWDAAAQAA